MRTFTCVRSLCKHTDTWHMNEVHHHRRDRHLHQQAVAQSVSQSVQSFNGLVSSRDDPVESNWLSKRRGRRELNQTELGRSSSSPNDCPHRRRLPGSSLSS